MEEMEEQDSGEQMSNNNYVITKNTNYNYQKNLWMRKAFWILFAGISLFIIVGTAPLLVIIAMNIVDFLMAVSMVLMSLLTGLVDFLVQGLSEATKSWIRGLWSKVPWMTPGSVSIIATYYCSTFFFVAIGIAAAFLIGAVAFYIYKKHQFNSMIEVPNLQIQQEKSPLEQRLERFKEQSAKENLPETGKDQNNLDYNA
ncbi:MAG: hypothetical protein IJU86_00260 [Firmicutes bacterium]|nr:hypothetical protein [Bacillota bacterium]